MEVVFCEEGVDFVSIFLCVYNYRGFSFVSTGNHCIILCDFMSNLFKYMKLSFVCGITVVGVV